MMFEGIRWIVWIAAVLAVSSQGADLSKIDRGGRHHKNKTTSISQLTELCPPKSRVQIVEATFNATGQQFTHSDLLATYEGVANRSHSTAAEKRLSQSGGFTITYICASGDTSATSPCRPKGNSSGTIHNQSSLLMVASNSECYKLVNIITIASHQKQQQQQEQLNVTFNVLFKEKISSDGSFINYRVNSRGKVGTWKCFKGGYETFSVTQDITLTIRLQLKSMKQITRFWVNLDDRNFDVSIEDDQRRINSSCGHTILPVLTMPPRTSVPTILHYVMTIVVPVLGAVIVTVIIAVTVYIVKRRTGSSLIRTAEREDEEYDQRNPRSRNDAEVYHHYFSPYMHYPANDSDTPEDTSRKPKLNYCTHNPDDYEDWVPPFLRMDTNV